jgi:hypothetical protein
MAAANPARDDQGSIAFRTYAITGPDGHELSDRWREAPVMKDMIRALWDRVAAEAG